MSDIMRMWRKADIEAAKSKELRSHQRRQREKDKRAELQSAIERDHGKVDPGFFGGTQQWMPLGQERLRK